MGSVKICPPAKRGPADGRVRALPDLHQVVDEPGDLAVVVAVVDVAVDAAGGAVVPRREAPQPPPAGQRVRRRLPELRDVAVGREHDAGQAAGGVVDALEADEPAVVVGHDVLAVRPLARVVQPHEQHLRLHPVQRVHQRAELEQRSARRSRSAGTARRGGRFRDGSPWRTTCTPCAAQKRVWSWTGSRPQIVPRCGRRRAGAGADGAAAVGRHDAGEISEFVGGKGHTSDTSDRRDSTRRIKPLAASARFPGPEDARSRKRRSSARVYGRYP